MRNTRRAVRWVLGCLGGGAMFFCGLMLVAHTDVGRPLLHWMAKSAGCPVDLDGGDPVKAEAFRIDVLKRQAAQAAASSHPAAGFVLGQTTRADVENWAMRVGAQCSDERKGSVMSCRLLEALDELRIEDMHLQFDAQARLVAVDLFRAQSCGADAVSHLRKVGAELTDEVGPATAVRGRLSPQYLSQAYRRAAYEYRYRDYRAQISATNLGSRGIRVREQYQWAPPSG